MSNLNNLKNLLALMQEAHAQSTQGDWALCNHGQHIVVTTDEDSNEIVQVMNKGIAFTVDEAEANMNFIVMAHGKFPEILEEFDRLQHLEYELNEAKQQITLTREELQSSRKTKQTLKKELRQMEKHSSLFLSTFAS